MQRRDFGMYPEDQPGVLTKTYQACTLMLVHTPMGHWCGYVKVPHWSMSTSYDKAPISRIDVHGGVTFSEGRDDGSVVVGFDCGHTCDWDDPLLQDKEWLWSQCWQMAEQLLKAKAHHG